jgi:tripartite-type tricarboxylate transporter receptor subunit TctC
MKRLLAMMLGATLGAGLFGGAARAQDYPAKAVRMVVPAGPGTSLDILGRSMSEVFTKRFNQSMYVESKPGAGGMLGANEGKNAPPDGYTLLLSYDAMENYPIFIKDNTFVLSRDLAPVSLMAGYPMVWVTTQTMEAKNLKDIVAYAKANPGKINFGVVPNTISQLYGILFIRRAGIDVTVVPYSTGLGFIQGALAGDIQVFPSDYNGVIEGLKAGKFKIFAVASNTRIKQDPSIPTFKELGLDVIAEAWYGLFAPKATPPAVINKLAAASADFAKMPDMIDRFQKIGLELYGTSPADFAKRIAEDTAARTEAAKLGNIQPQ